MRIKKRLQELLDETDYYLSNNIIGLTDGESHKYLLYWNSHFGFVKGFDTQDEIIEWLEEKHKC